MRRTLAAVSVLAVVLSLAPIVAAGGDQVVICHVPPGNPEAAHTITIGAPAVETHLSEHDRDTLGPCPGDGEQSPADKSPGKDEGTNPDETGPSPSAVATGSATWLWLLLVALAALAAATAYAIWRRRVGAR